MYAQNKNERRIFLKFAYQYAFKYRRSCSKRNFDCAPLHIRNIYLVGNRRVFSVDSVSCDMDEYSWMGIRLQ